jgi:hypothetical protein
MLRVKVTVIKPSDEKYLREDSSFSFTRMTINEKVGEVRFYGVFGEEGYTKGFNLKFFRFDIIQEAATP